MSSRTRTWLIVIPGALVLFLFALTDIGLVGPDEPRYASIAREMARSGDWVTPRLWGKPWFEKPPLLYWMVGAAFKAGLSRELAPRLPVAVFNLAFLWFFYRLLRAEFGRRPALFSSAILGTSAMWLAFSHLGATDLPMSATFALAMLCGVRWYSTAERRWLLAAAALLGLSVLAKGLVPIILSAPLLWLGRKRLAEFLKPAPLAVFLAVALPWYWLCTVRNGAAFINEFFWRHHFARLASDTLLHQQPFWFYLPVFIAGLFPWTPLFVVLFRQGAYADERRRFLLLWMLFGLLFFSAVTNKLPGYLLPLFPAAAILTGLALDELRDARAVLASCCLLLLAVPVVAGSLPNVLMVGGVSRASIGGWNWAFALTYFSLAGITWCWEEIGRRESAVGLLIVAVTLGVAYIKVKSFPSLDRLATARPLWERVSDQASFACVENIHRNWRYGLNFYSVTPLPECSDVPRAIRIRQIPGHPPFVN